MGIYLNPDNISFKEALNSEIYIDKTGLIRLTNKIIRTEQKYLCISRPRRFGKSMAANMLAAYYSRGCDSDEMFQKYQISNADSYQTHLNQYNVIRLNMMEFSSNSGIRDAEAAILFDVKEEFPDIRFFDPTQLARTLMDVYAKTKIPFIFIIDEWDCLFREHKNDMETQSAYLIFLRNLLKDRSYVALAYMTGILPVKKYGIHSALNMFTEVSMTNTREYSEFTGFTESEVQALCQKYDMPYDEMKHWYDGYCVRGMTVYNPRSVVMSVTGHDFDNYWTSTETYEALKVYIAMDFDGLNAKIVRLVAGDKIEINTKKFQNDMTTFQSADDILTLLVHLGYLTYDFYTKKVWIPNDETACEFVNAIEDGGWERVVDSIRKSDELLNATLNGNSNKVAALIQQCHMEENSLEMPAGEGFADLIFLPRKNAGLPALIVELKRDKSAECAIEQIKRRRYQDKIRNYCGEVILAGISYDSKEKTHSCVIEKAEWGRML